ncbi:MAG: pyridoxamine 5'-phosphate oxidase family protein [Bacteroidales bacterium]|nr:pyridoxamine 5'-phosphate oxidase family protein [Bacteroidales bacterium]
MRRNEQEITDINTIYEILDQSEVCRLALHDSPYPYIVPLNFGYEDQGGLCLYFHCALEGKKLDLIRKNNKVCFETEANTRLVRSAKACGWSMEYRSVIGYGTLGILEEEELVRHGLKIVMRHYSGTSAHDFDALSLSRCLVLRLQVESYSAKQHKQS